MIIHDSSGFDHKGLQTWFMEQAMMTPNVATDTMDYDHDRDDDDYRSDSDHGAIDIKDRSSSDDGDDEAYAETFPANPSSPPSSPSDATGVPAVSSLELLEHVGIYLNRRSFNQLSILNKQVYQTCQWDGSTTKKSNMYPWPSPKHFRVGSRAWTVAFSYDNGRTIACGTDLGMVHVWYCSTGKKISLNCMLTDENDNDQNQPQRRRSVRSNRNRNRLGGSMLGSRRINCVVYCPSSIKTVLAAAGDDGYVRVWKEETTSPNTTNDDTQDHCVGEHQQHNYGWIVMARLKANHPISCIAFVPQSRCNENDFYGQREERYDNNVVTTTTKIVASCLDNYIRIFMIEKQLCIAVLPCQGPILSIVMLQPPSSSSSSQSRCMVQDKNATTKDTQSYSFVTGGSREEQRLCLWEIIPSCSDQNTREKNLNPTYQLEHHRCQVLFDASTSSQTSFEVGGIDIRSIAMAPDGSFLAFACGKQIGVYVFARDDQQHDVSTHRRRGLNQEVVETTSMASGSCSASSSRNCHFLKGHLGDVRTVSVCPNIKVLASACSHGTVRLWRVSDGLCVKKWVAHADFLVCCIAFPPTNESNGRSLVSAGSDGTISVWNE